MYIYKVGGILFDLYKDRDINNFNWDVVGNPEIGRTNLGDSIPTFVYQLLQFSIRTELEKEFGQDKSIDIIRRAGKIAGREFANHMLDLTLPLNEFIAMVQKSLVDNKIGILKIEKLDRSAGIVILTIAEDLDCAYLPVKGEQVCNFDEGFIAGVLGEYSKKTYKVREIDCWVTSARVCRFIAEVEVELEGVENER